MWDRRGIAGIGSKVNGAGIAADPILTSAWSSRKVPPEGSVRIGKRLAPDVSPVCRQAGFRFRHRRSRRHPVPPWYRIRSEDRHRVALAQPRPINPWWLSSSLFPALRRSALHLQEWTTGMSGPTAACFAILSNGALASGRNLPQVSLEDRVNKSAISSGPGKSPWFQAVRPSSEAASVPFR